MVTFRTTVVMTSELTCVDHILTLGALDPSTKPVFFNGTNLNFGFMPLEKAQKLHLYTLLHRWSRIKPNPTLGTSELSKEPKRRQARPIQFKNSLEFSWGYGKAKQIEAKAFSQTDRGCSSPLMSCSITSSNRETPHNCMRLFNF